MIAYKSLRTVNCYKYYINVKLDGGGVKSLIKSPCLPHRSRRHSRTQHDIGKCEGQKCPGNIETLL